MANTEKNRDEWLAQVNEPALEPDLPIVDPHHHLWDHPGSRYMLDEVLRDTGSGHRVLATVFVECMSMYRADGAESMRPVGETEFVNGVAAMSASGVYGPVRACAGIVGHADCTAGEAKVDELLEAHLQTSDRFRGIRHSCSSDVGGDGLLCQPKPLSGMLIPPSLAKTLGHRASSVTFFFHSSKISARCPS